MSWESQRQHRWKNAPNVKEGNEEQIAQHLHGEKTVGMLREFKENGQIADLVFG